MNAEQKYLSKPIGPAAGAVGAVGCTPQPGLAFVILLGCPEGLHVGIDYRLWKVKSQFMGVHSIPLGPHYVYWDTSADGSGFGGMRAGLFVCLAKAEVFVRRWNKATELFEEAEEDESFRMADAVKDHNLYRHLGPYDLSVAKEWHEMSMFVSKNTIARIEPVQKLIAAGIKPLNNSYIPSTVNSQNEPTAAAMSCSGGDSDSKGNSSSATKAASDSHGCRSRCKNGGEELKKTELRKKGKTFDGNDDTDEDDNDESPEIAACSGTLFFTDIPRVTIPYGSSYEATSHLGTDRSILLDKLISEDFRGEEKELLGELQFAYICFLLGQRWEGFDQWKRLLTFVCNCEEAIYKRPKLFGDVIRIVYSQLQQAPDDFFNNELLKGNFFATCLLNLSDFCTSEKASKLLQSRIVHLNRLVTEKFKMNVEELRQLVEDPPVYVESNETFVSFD